MEDIEKKSNKLSKYIVKKITRKKSKKKITKRNTIKRNYIYIKNVFYVFLYLYIRICMLKIRSSHVQKVNSTQFALASLVMAFVF